MGFIVKNTTLPSLLDLVAPLSCRGCGKLGVPLCDNCKNYIIKHHQDLCPSCRRPKSALQCPHCKNLPSTFVLDTRDHLTGTLVHDLKYHSVRPLAKDLASLLDATFPTLPAGKIIIVPLPTISRHIRERGLDHTFLVAKHFAKLRGHGYQVQKLLTRHHNTVQVGTDRTTRLAQASAAYQLADNTPLDPTATYILLDDVWTTGASLESAYQKISSAGAKEIILAILALSV